MNKWLRYGRVGIDTDWANCPIQFDLGKIFLCDGLYDVADTPLHQEIVLLAIPLLEDDPSAEYWNPKTKLFAQIWEE